MYVAFLSGACTCVVPGAVPTYSLYTNKYLRQSCGIIWRWGGGGGGGGDAESTWPAAFVDGTLTHLHLVWQLGLTSHYHAGVFHPLTIMRRWV